MNADRPTLCPGCRKKITPHEALVRIGSGPYTCEVCDGEIKLNHSANIKKEKQDRISAFLADLKPILEKHNASLDPMDYYLEISIRMERGWATHTILDSLCPLEIDEYFSRFAAIGATANDR